MNQTFGNWKVIKRSTDKDIHVCAEFADNLTFVCNCGNPDGESLPSNPDAEANARLISASPDMYEALIKLVHKFRVSGEILGFTEAHLLKELEQAEKALNKAEEK